MELFVKVGRANIKLPMRPNFLFVKNEAGRLENYPLDAFTDEELWEVGQEYARELIRKAERQGAFRSEKKTPLLGPGGQ